MSADQDTLDNQLDWLWLLRAPGFAGGSARKLLTRFGDLRSALEAGPGGWREAGLDAPTIDWMQSTPRAPLDSDRQWFEAPDSHLVTLESRDYPALLRRIPDPPAALYVVGNVDALWRPQLAIVGSRNATRAGLDNAADFAATFCRAGFAVVSGLALGVDGAAHAACLKADAATVAVMGTGVDKIYPARHRSLAREITARGALVSEYPPGTAPSAGNFPRRNRIISGLALGTLVIEAGVRSGSLITARLAGEQGREVFALPGSIHNPMARGCHRLIRQGAKLVETAEEVLQELGGIAGELAEQLRARIGEPDDPAGAKGTEPPLDDEYRAVLEALGHDPASVDRIVERTGLTVESVSSMLLILELEGHIDALPGGLYAAAPKSEDT